MVGAPTFAFGSVGTTPPSFLKDYKVDGGCESDRWSDESRPSVSERRVSEEIFSMVMILVGALVYLDKSIR